MEVQDLNLVITDQVLTKGIKENKEFQDEKNIFSRTKYEKFLLSSNLTAPEFELSLRENELKRELFNYISGGLVPPIFSVKRNIKEQTKKVTIDFLNLSEIYRKKESFTNEEISSFIKDGLMNIDFSSIKLGGFVFWDFSTGFGTMISSIVIAITEKQALRKNNPFIPIYV